ncbi:hypothetical protein PENPOL_c005G06713 [Penicillium polonicum]|uniref:Protein kinase domain-containing protein n=1 Tax=Penicillium polonicum TaxID=60169 RepID=A0A1V6NM70_PENPO|nr:hypothetical protein PENPOL_c005G06713 [Penicillium polonicum]
MAQISDLVRDSKLETFFLADGGVKTVHTFRESDPTSGRRLVTRQGHWQRQRRVGGGASGSVWIEKCTDCGRLGGPQGDAVRAVKQIDMKTSLRSIDYNRELESIPKFSHTKYKACFVKSFGWYEGPGQLFIAMEYLELGDLLGYLDQRPPLPEAEAQDIASQILEGLDMMHENGFAHRDLKPNMKSVILHHPEPTAPTLYMPSLLSPVATRPDTDGSASWTRKSSSDASEILSHDMSVPTTTTPDSLLEAGEIPNLARKTRDSSLHTEELRPIKDPFENLRPSSTELKFQVQAARALSRQEHNAEAETVFRQALKGQGRYKEAVEIFERSVEGREKTLGPDHEDTLSSVQWLGNSLGQQDRWEEAERMFYRTYKGRTKVLGPDHPHTLHSAQCLGVALSKQRQYTDAETVLRGTLQRQEMVLGHDHEDYIYSRKLLQVK